jgi:diguanylate cyclase (GGDEF)-like protein
MTVKQLTSASIALFVILVSSITLLSLASFSHTQKILAQVTSEYRPKVLSALHLATHFYQSSSVIGTYMIEKDPATLALYHSKISDINSTLDELTRLSSLNDDPADVRKLGQIKQLVGVVKAANTQLLSLANSDAKNFPAIGRATDELEPLAMQINQQISDTLMLAEQYQQSAMLFDLSNLRFIWTMLVSEMRNFLAFRNHANLSKIEMYIDGVIQAQQSVMQNTIITDTDQLELFEETSANLLRFQHALRETLALHSSNKWRQDSLIIRATINPTLKQITADLEELVNSQLKRIRESDNTLYSQIYLAENIIFGATAVAAIIASYLIFVNLRTRRLTSELRRRKLKEREMWHKANYDHLTKLANRSLFNESLKSFLISDKLAPKLSLLFIDLDGFKQVNDSISHAAGDAVLLETANRLKAIVRDVDVVGRMGGDEFTILLRGVNCPYRVEKIAKAICTAIAKQYLYQGKAIFISSSIGIVLSQPNDFDNEQSPANQVAKSLMTRADSAMYRAKRNGKNAFCFENREHAIKALNTVPFIETT